MPDTPQIFDLGTIEATTEVDLPEFDTYLDPAATEDGIYTDYLVEITFDRDRHILQMPVADSSVTAASFAYLAMPTMKKRVRWEAVKIGVPPTAPLADTNIDNEICLSDAVSTVTVDTGSQGTALIYTLSGEYVYGVVDPTEVEYFFPVPPYVADTDPCSETTTDFAHGIIDCGENAAGQSGDDEEDDGDESEN